MWILTIIYYDLSFLVYVIFWDILKLDSRSSFCWRNTICLVVIGFMIVVYPSASNLQIQLIFTIKSKF